MKLQDLIVESFDKPYPYKEASSTRTHWKAVGRTDEGEDIVVYADDISMYVNMQHPSHSMWDISFNRDGQDGVTGQGDATRIFATVVAIIKECITKYKMDIITLGSSKRQSNRGQLYSRLVARYANQLGYDVVIKDSGDPRLPQLYVDCLDEEYPGLDIIVLVRK